MRIESDVANLAHTALVAHEDETVEHDARPHAAVDEHTDEVLQSGGGTVGHLAHGSHGAVVGQRHGYAETPLEHAGKGDVALPLKVGSILDALGDIVAAGCTDAHRLDVAPATDALHHRLKAVTDVEDKGRGVRVVGSWHGILTQYVAQGIHDAKHRGGFTHTHTYHVGAQTRQFVKFYIVHGVVWFTFRPKSTNYIRNVSNAER